MERMLTENKTTVRKNLVEKDFVMPVYLDFKAGKEKKQQLC